MKKNPRKSGLPGVFYVRIPGNKMVFHIGEMILFPRPHASNTERRHMNFNFFKQK